MIVHFEIPKIKQSLQKHRSNPLNTIFSPSPSVVTSIYVPVMDGMGFEFAHEREYMWIFKANDSEIPTVTKGRTVEHNFDGIIYRTTDGTDARKRLEYELVVSNAVKNGGDMERGKVLFKLSEAEPMS